MILPSIRAIRQVRGALVRLRGSSRGVPTLCESMSDLLPHITFYGKIWLLNIRRKVRYATFLLIISFLLRAETAAEVLLEHENQAACVVAGS